MPLVINSNISSLNSQRQLVKSGAELDQAMERLSSGKRINTAADDAAGLAISNRQTSTILGLNRAVANANDGVSLVQTTEGALDETTNILQRMRELAIQSANGIFSDADRATLNAEAQQLKAEVDRIAETTAFNGRNVLDGTLGDVALQVGSNANQTIDFTVSGFSASSLGGSSGDVVGDAVTNISLVTLTGADGDIIINDVDISLVTAGTLNEELASINADLDGKGAEISALTTLVSNGVGDGKLIAGTDTFTITVSDGDTNAQVYIITGTNDMDELIAKINSETAVEASLDSDGKMVLSQEGVGSITVADSGADAVSTGFTAGAGTANYSIVLTDTSADKNGIKIEGTDAAAVLRLQTEGLNANNDDGNLLGGAITTFATINAGDFSINGVDIGAVETATTAAEQQAAVINAVNDISDQTGVVAFSGALAVSIELRSSTGDEISIERGTEAFTDAILLSNTGFIERNSASGAGSVASVDISTAAGSQKAIDIIDVALEQINAQRSELGAISNRLDFTVSNLMNVSENTAAARSRIVDADFAAETANLSRAQVLQQASTAMLAQANAAPQQVLSLLR